MDPLQQSLGDDFEIVRPLGEGNFGEGFLARERSLDRPVAVKVLRAVLALDDTARPQSGPTGTPPGVRVLQALAVVLAPVVAGLIGWLFMVR